MRAFQRRIGEHIFHLENRAVGALAHKQIHSTPTAREIKRTMIVSEIKI